MEQLSAEVSLNSDSQKDDGRQNGDAAWTSAGEKNTFHKGSTDMVLTWVDTDYQ